MSFPSCDGEIKHDLSLDKFKMANLARQGSRNGTKAVIGQTMERNVVRM